MCKKERKASRGTGQTYVREKRTERIKFPCVLHCSKDAQRKKEKRRVNQAYERKKNSIFLHFSVLEIFECRGPCYLPVKRKKNKKRRKEGRKKQKREGKKNQQKKSSHPVAVGRGLEPAPAGGVDAVELRHGREQDFLGIQGRGAVPREVLELGDAVPRVLLSEKQ